MIKNKQQAGFSLIELMVALVIGLFVMGVVITVFVQSKRNYNQDEEIARLQESGRYAIQLLSRELAMAGFLGNMQLADSVTMSLPSGTVCDIDWNTESPLEKPIKVIDADSPPSCLTEALSGTEIVVIKHMRGQALSSTSADTIVMESNGKDGNMFVAPTDMTAPTDYQHWEFLVRAYYIADEDGDGVPGLYRKRVIASGGALQVQADGNLVPGVEDFRVTYGIDSAGNGIANYYTAAPSVTVTILLRHRLLNWDQLSLPEWISLYAALSQTHLIIMTRPIILAVLLLQGRAWIILAATTANSTDVCLLPLCRCAMSPTIFR
jgi:type IV pilus assembly protein PilW